MKKCTSLVVAATAAIVVLGSRGVAFATQPTVTPIDGSFSFTSDLCPFSVRVHEHAQGRDIVYYDASGAPTREVLLQTITGTWTNRATGASLLEKSRLTSVLPADGGFSEMGLNFHIRLPDGRTVLIDAGNLFFDDGELRFEAGKHQVEDGDVEAFCAALS